MSTHRTGIALGLACLGLVLGALYLSVGRTKPPNIVLVIIDTMRADRFGTYGYTRPTTPNIDALAARSVVFDRAFGHAPWTAPTIAGIMTAMDPVDHGIIDWNQTLPEPHWTLAEHLRGKGYFTMAVVSHVVFEKGLNFHQGFQRYNTGALGLGHPEKAVSSKFVTDAAIAQLDEWGDREPFFLWTHYFDPHNDYIPHPGRTFVDEPHPGPEIQSWSDRYDSEVLFTDHHVGRLLDALEARGLLDHTVIGLVGDHGEEFKDHGGIWHSQTLFNELVRVPMMISAPGLAPGRYSDVVASSDMAPTLLTLAGLRPARSWSRRAIPFVDGRLVSDGHRDVVIESFRYARKRGLLRWPYKIIDDQEHRRVSLYDLEADWAERDDLAPTRPEALEAMKRALEQTYARPRYPVQYRKQTDEEKEQLEALGYLE